MKFLKKYNDSKAFIKELEDECKNYLSYLLDENPELIIEIRQYSSSIFKFILRFDGASYTYFQWNKIKYEFLPFLEMFNNKYFIVNSKSMNVVLLPDIIFLEVFNNMDKRLKFYPLDDVLDGIMDNKVEIYNGIEEQVRLRKIIFYFKPK